MTRTPDEIKKGLELCSVGFYENICTDCPYSSLAMAECPTKLKVDALALIRWHEEKNEAMHAEIVRLQAELDAAVTFLPRRCHLCKHVGNKMGDAPCPSFCEYITLEECPNWQWRGVQKEDDDA